MLRPLAALLLAAGLAPAPAVAIELPAPDSTICYGRAYSDSHLRANPAQVARRLVLALHHFAEYDQLAFSLEVVLAGDEGHIWWSGGGCHAEGERFLCAVDCDGGAFHLTAGKAGDLLLQNDAQGFVLQANCGDELPEEPAITHVAADAANATYRLVRLPEDFCPQWELLD